MTHTIVTQVIVTLDPSNGEWNVSTVTEKVQKELSSFLTVSSFLSPKVILRLVLSFENPHARSLLYLVQPMRSVLPDKELINIDGDEAEPQ